MYQVGLNRENEWMKPLTIMNKQDNQNKGRNQAQVPTYLKRMQMNLANKPNIKFT